MRDLARSLRERIEAVPVPWESLARLIRPRIGNLVLAQAAPGAGKSTFALNWVLGVDSPTLYLSFDTDLRDQALRTVSHLRGVRAEAVEHDLDAWSAWLEGQDHPVRFFDRYVGADAVGEIVAAETEYWGVPPALTVVDNAYNLLEGEESAAEFRRIFAVLHRVAKEQRTCVLALHHLRRVPAKEDQEPAAEPVTLTSGLYAGEQEAHIMLGLWQPSDGLLAAGILKNRAGRANPNGKLFASLTYDPELARITERDQLDVYKESIGAQPEAV